MKLIQQKIQQKKVKYYFKVILILEVMKLNFFSFIKNFF